MKKSNYHHGNLRNALLTATTELVRDRGARGFSVSEVARRVGVSSSAPYRHFDNRDSMLAAAALAGFTDLEKRYEALPEQLEFADTAVLIVTEYLKFAYEDPARFEVMFAHGINKTEHPDLLQQTLRVQERFEATLSRYLKQDVILQRAGELWALAHGVTTLAIGGNLQHVLSDVEISGLADSVARTWANGIS